MAMAMEVMEVGGLGGRDALEFVCAPLPFASQLDTYLDAAE